LLIVITKKIYLRETPATENILIMYIL